MDKDFESWLKNELSDIEVEYTEEEIFKLFLEFARSALIVRRMLLVQLTPIGIEPTDDMVIKYIQDKWDKGGEKA